MNKHNTLIRNTIFRNVQNSPIFLISEESVSSFKSHCYFRDDFTPNPQSGNLIIKNKETSNDAFQNTGDHRPFFILKDQYTCGYLKIAGCIFKNCNSRTHGGGIFVSQHENILLHETLFDSCHAEGHCGGCCCICGKKLNYDDNEAELKDEQLPQADIQYCCFQNCYGAKNYTMGTVIFIAAIKMNLNYTSSNNCSCIIKSEGAQFDIQSENPTSEHMNMTGGISMYCGSMEYRYSNIGYYRFQTIMNISSKYCIAFTYSEMIEVSVIYCNLISNIAVKIYKSCIPSFIVIADYNLTVEKLYFINNKFINGSGLYMGRMNKRHGTFTVINCYFDDPNENRYNYDYSTYYNCIFGTPSFTQCSLTHVSLGACAGNKTAEPIILTNTFSHSFFFSPSLNFLSTCEFSKSNIFSLSKIFTKTNYFTFSNLLTDSNSFSLSEYFSKSFQFSCTNIFSKSDMFTFSSFFHNTFLFSLSNEFSESNKFESSLLFSQSLAFTISNFFSKSKIFTKSSFFTKSIAFSDSNLLSQSNVFIESKTFSSSNINLHSKKFTSDIQIFEFSYQPKKKTSIWIITLIPIFIFLIIIAVVIIILFLHRYKNKLSSSEEDECKSQKINKKEVENVSSNKFVFEDDTDYDLDFWI